MGKISGKHCSPIDIALVNDQVVRVSYINGEFHWHKHKDQDELFYILKGKLIIKLKDQSDIILSEGQMSRITGNMQPSAPQTVDAEYLLGWLEGKLVFERTPLNEIVSELERYYDVSIELEVAGLAQNTITASFENSPLEPVLSSICLTLGARYKFEADTYIITSEQ